MSAYLWSYAACTARGLKRENNEDNVYLEGTFLPHDGLNERAVFTGASSRGVLAVFDGLGGESYGELAAYEAARVLDGHAKALAAEAGAEGAGALAEKYIKEANADILKLSRRLCSRMGTTLALLIFNENKICALNMGDSRIYLSRGGGLERLSRDHTLAELLVMRGELAPAAAKTDPRRNSLVKYLGAEEGEHDFKPHFAPVERAERGDRFLLCSDGLTDMLPEGEIAAILEGAESPGAASEELAAAAVRAGGGDNVTALCAFVQ